MCGRSFAVLWCDVFCGVMLMVVVWFVNVAFGVGVLVVVCGVDAVMVSFVV